MHPPKRSRESLRHKRRPLLRTSLGGIREPRLRVFLAALLLIPAAAFPGPLERYIRKNYIVPDKVYEFAPAHQYKNLGRVSVQHLIPSCPGDIACRPVALSDGLFLIRHDLVNKTFAVERLDQMKNVLLKDYKNFVAPVFTPAFTPFLNDIVFEDLTVSRRGEFLFFRYDKIDRSSSALTLNDLASSRPFFQGLVYIFRGKAMRCDIEITSEDPETGGYQRSLWDVFRFNGRDFVLILKSVYESDNYEAFEITGAGLKKILEFGFGGI
ncbi:MAG: hypothetical protein PHX45_08145 [Acidobacteriota bacterium]|nr:hypothetical protein [Acidobacteriota bacterium]